MKKWLSLRTHSKETDGHPKCGVEFEKTPSADVGMMISLFLLPDSSLVDAKNLLKATRRVSDVIYLSWKRDRLIIVCSIPDSENLHLRVAIDWGTGALRRPTSASLRPIKEI